MKAISLWQPWASLVAHGLKEYETRSWATNYRGELAIHATKAFPKGAKYIAQTLEAAFPEVGRVLNRFGYPIAAVVGIVRLVDCLEMTPRLISSISHREEQMGNWCPGRFAWNLELVEAFAEPIPARGAQGFWNWEPPVSFKRLKGEE